MCFDRAGITVDVLGTDLDPQAINRARAGCYGRRALRATDVTARTRWFSEQGDELTVEDAIRRRVRFAVHNLVNDPDPDGGPFDIVLCRNVLLYLSADKKTLGFERLMAAMAEDGWLMLGAGETVIGQTSKLGADINARGLYRLVGDGGRVEKRQGDRRLAAGGA
jgi:chemotaxis protein methyltransferase CheR